MICDVVASKTVALNERIAVARNKSDFPSGMSLTLEYTLADGKGLSIAFYETVSGSRLIEELFPSDAFRGVSPFTDLAEFRASFSEASIGRFGVNYKGSDQLFIKNGCGDGNWRGHFIQTYIGADRTLVVSLDCRPTSNVADEFFSRLKSFW